MKDNIEYCFDWITKEIIKAHFKEKETGKMAKLLNRNFIGIEISEEYYNIAKERIENTNIQESLF